MKLKNCLAPESRPHSLIERTLFLCPLLVLNAACLAQEAPEAKFDVAYEVECRDVTPQSLRERSDERFIEARFRISTQLLKVPEKDICQITYDICDPTNVLTVVDYLPKKDLSSDVAGTIDIVESKQISNGFNGNAGGAIGFTNGAQVSAGVSYQHSSSNSKTETYKKLPPRSLILAAGTINRSRGVDFKLKPSNQDTLEGEREFTTIFRTSNNWRAGYVEIKCTATRMEGVFTKNEATLSQRTFYVGLFLEGDDEGRWAAHNLARVYEQYGATLTKGFRIGKTDSLNPQTINGSSRENDQNMQEYMQRVGKSRQELNEALLALARLSDSHTKTSKPQSAAEPQGEKLHELPIDLIGTWVMKSIWEADSNTWRRVESGAWAIAKSRTLTFQNGMGLMNVENILSAHAPGDSANAVIGVHASGAKGQTAFSLERGDQNIWVYEEIDPSFHVTFRARFTVSKD